MILIETTTDNKVERLVDRMIDAHRLLTIKLLGVNLHTEAYTMEVHDQAHTSAEAMREYLFGLATEMIAAEEEAEEIDAAEWDRPSPYRVTPVQWTAKMEREAAERERHDWDSLCRELGIEPKSPPRPRNKWTGW